MSLPEPSSFALLREQFGFVPRLFQHQAFAPRLLDAEVAFLDALLFRPTTLSRARKEALLLAVAACRRSRYWYTLHRHTLPLLGPVGDSAFSSPAQSLDAILVRALGNFLCTIADGLHPNEDFPAAEPPESAECPMIPPPAALPPGPQPAAFEPLRDHYGFIPRLFRAQTARPDALAAQAAFIETLTADSSALTRRQKELILLVAAARNRNAYLVALETQELAVMGVAPEDADQIALDHRAAGRASNVTEPPTSASGLEALLTAALGDFLCSLQAGLAVEPDFPLRITFPAPSQNNLHPQPPDSRPTLQPAEIDPDAGLVDAAQRGDLAAFEQLVARHGRRVYRTLVGILGNTEEARDLMQDTFLKAFQHLSAFERRSKFSTWLISIASRAGIQHLRERRPREESLDDTAEEGFRPRQVRAWTDDPEQAYAKAETRALVERELRRLPSKYRIAVMLRDIEQLSTEEAAAALELGVPALKARVLRGRLMLREALSSHFAQGGAA